MIWLEHEPNLLPIRSRFSSIFLILIDLYTSNILIAKLGEVFFFSGILNKKQVIK